jgi:hypothetical protein
MIKVCIMNQKRDDALFSVLKEMELSRVPVSGDKILIADTKNGYTTTYVYNVVDVHFDDYGYTDVFVVNTGRQEDYFRNLAAIHKSK